MFLRDLNNKKLVCRGVVVRNCLRYKAAMKANAVKALDSDRKSLK
jgi:hypothetical protein